eukprot:jgi/Botrbrau1/14211/Bobra.0254s0001.1
MGPGGLQPPLPPEPGLPPPLPQELLQPPLPPDVQENRQGSHTWNGTDGLTPPLPLQGSSAAPPPLPAEVPLPDFLGGTTAEAPGPSEAGRWIGTGEASEAPATTPEEEELLLKEFFREVRETDRDSEVNRILGAFRLNPFEQLGLRFDCSLEDIRRQYRKISLLVHPDKCKHPLAKDAFEVLGNAQKQLLDEEKAHELRYVLTMARDQVRQDRKKATKRDAVVRLASLVHEKGREGIEEAWENSNDFHEQWKMKARDILGRTAYRQSKIAKRLKAEEEKIEVEEAETRKKLKADREHRKNWEESREVRVGTWRDFVGKKGKKGVSMMGGIKPPKLKTEDEERTYIQRPVGEQYRPPPVKGAPKRGP